MLLSQQTPIYGLQARAALHQATLPPFNELYVAHDGPLGQAPSQRCQVHVCRMEGPLPARGDRSALPLLSSISAAFLEGNVSEHS
jgi:hypothetical protein